MSPVGNLIRSLAPGMESAETSASGSLLPAVLSPLDLLNLVKRHYEPRFAITPCGNMNLCGAFPIPQYNLRTGTVRGLGAGIGDLRNFGT